MILPASGDVVSALNPFGENIGMRVPDCHKAQEFLELSGPLATSSANLAGQSPALNAEEVNRYFPRLPLLAPLPWLQASGMASTVIRWEKPGNWRVLRKGAVILKN